jgi:glycosyltransferase involved in cell wall biosynthesis
MSQRVSLVMTVLNEGQTIEHLLDSLAQQTRPPDEVVIVDGGSRDDTVGRVRDWCRRSELPVTLFEAPGSNISAGRNLAIQRASGEIIAVTDAGVRLEPDWLERLVAPFAVASPPDVVSGFFLSDPQTPFERVLGAITLPRVAEIDAATFFPSSRSVALAKTAWAQVGGYPEWLDYCEDLLFDFALRDAGAIFGFAPRAIVHFRPRTTLRAYYRQYYRYARGDGKADFWRYRHAVRYGTYGLLIVLLLLALLHQPWWWIPWALTLGATLWRPMRRLRPLLAGRLWGARVQALLWGAVIAWAGDLAKMLGYPVGVWWRWRHAPSGPWPKRQW